MFPVCVQFYRTVVPGEECQIAKGIPDARAVDSSWIPRGFRKDSGVFPEGFRGFPAWFRGFPGPNHGLPPYETKVRADENIRPSALIKIKEVNNSPVLVFVRPARPCQPLPSRILPGSRWEPRLLAGLLFTSIIPPADQPGEYSGKRRSSSSPGGLSFTSITPLADQPGSYSGKRRRNLRGGG